MLSGVPIVLVLKSDHSVCICGDIKQTSIQPLGLIVSPVPKVEDLFAKLSGRRIISK